MSTDVSIQESSKKRNRDMSENRGIVERSPSFPGTCDIPTPSKKSKKSHKKSKSVSSIASNLTDDKRLFAIQEIVNTEKSYVECLGLVMKVSYFS